MKEYVLKDEIAMVPACMSINDRGIWFINAMLPIIYFYDFKEEKVNWYKVIPKCKNSQLYSFLGIYEYENKLFLIPDNANKVMVYDKIKDFFREIEINDISYGAFRGCTCLDNILYCIPFKYNKIIGIDVVTDKIVHEIEWRKTNGLSDVNYINDYAVQGERLLAVVPHKNMVLKCNLKERTWDSFYVGGENNSYVAIGCLNNTGYLFDLHNNSIHCCNIDEKRINTCMQIESKAVRITTGRDYLILDNVLDDKWILMDKNHNVVRQDAYNYRDIKNAFSTPYNYACWGQNEKGNLIGIDNYNHIIEIDAKGNKKEKFLFVDRHIWEKSLTDNDIINELGFYQENDVYSLPFFINLL